METDLKDILALPSRLAWTAGLSWWVQNLYPDESVRPVLVGGAAMELHTEGSYVTADLDFVGIVPPPVAASLGRAGFRRLSRHWLDEVNSVSIIFQGERLRHGEMAVELKFGGYPVLIISPEDLLVDRLSTWVHRESATHGVQAYLLYHAAHGPMDLNHLRRRAAAEAVGPALDALTKLFFRTKGELPDAHSLGEWASRMI